MSDHSDVRLCPGTTMNPKARYMTLGHCWGPEGLDFKLNLELEGDFFKQIPWARLPETFKDAILLT